MAVTYSVHLGGMNECIAALGGVSDAIKRKYIRIALNAAGGQLKQAAVARVPMRTKLLKQAMSVKVAQKRNGEWYVVVGAKRGLKRALRVTKAGRTRAISKKGTSNLKFTPGAGKETYADPVRYLHLVEKGTRSHFVSVKNKKVLAGNGGIWGRRAAIKAKPARFMAAAAQGAGPSVVQRGVDKLKEQIQNHKPDSYYRDERGQFRRRA